MYKVLVDYHSEGHKFLDGEWEDLTEAVKAGMSQIFGNPFLIVKVVDWEATEI